MRSFKEELDEIERFFRSEEFKNEVERTRNQLLSRPIVLYGAGALGISIAGILKRDNVPVVCFGDTYKKDIERETGLSIITPQTLASDYPDTNILICSIGSADAIERNLIAIGVAPDRILRMTSLTLNIMTFEDLEQHLCGYERAYNLFNDDLSKQIVIERIRCYLTSLPVSVSPYLQYFDAEIVKLEDDETFIDGGMYDGDTALQFFKQVDGKYGHYYGFEPDKKNYDAAVKSLGSKQGVTLIQKGLWSSKTSLKFIADMTTDSKVSSMAGDVTIDVTSLDAYFDDKTPPSFIKMDIEGAELEALKGAEQIIRTYKPKLAICAYHKPEDVYTIPELINSYRDDYSLYLRHYTNNILETVLYAV